MNSRMINGIFDDLNPSTQQKLWHYQDTGTWNASRNSMELVIALKDYAAHGLNALTVGLQGGSPCGVCTQHVILLADSMSCQHITDDHSPARIHTPGNNPADNHAPCGEMYNRDSSAFGEDGSLRPAFFQRLSWIIEEADRLGMVVLIQFFYPDMAFKVGWHAAPHVYVSMGQSQRAHTAQHTKRGEHDIVASPPQLQTLRVIPRTFLSVQ